MTRLPDFVIAGERRCGTTSTYYWLQGHPDIFLYPRSDMNYFTEEELNTRSWRDGEVDPAHWERAHSVEEYAELFREGVGHTAIGHKGADLLFWKPAHKRIAQFLPKAKFIIILRNPVNRAWSHYWNEVGKGRENLSFDEALSAEEERSRDSAYARFHLSYLARGFYEQSLAAFFQFVAPDRVLIVTVEQFKVRPNETLSEIYNFIGVTPEHGLELAGIPRNTNWTTVPRVGTAFPVVRTVEKIYARMSEGVIVRTTKDPERRRKLRIKVQSIFRKPASSISMPEVTRARLARIYRPHIDALESFLNRQFVEWKS